MFFLHPKSEKDQESKELTRKFFTYLLLAGGVIAAVRYGPKLIPTLAGS
jgi:hypothetical protein